MATSKGYLEFILEQLSGLDEITYRSKIAAYICDDRLLVKPVKSAISLMPEASYETPYEGAKDMLLVNEVDNKEFLTELFIAMYDELPVPKKKK